jgi:hypothetical protein
MRSGNRESIVLSAFHPAVTMLAGGGAGGHATRRALQTRCGCMLGRELAAGQMRELEGWAKASAD